MTAARRIVVIGAGGQAREVRWALDCLAPRFKFIGFVVTDLTKMGPNAELSRSYILGDYDWLRRHRYDFDAAIIAIGDPAARLSVAAALEPELHDWAIVVHPSAVFDRASCKLSPGVFISAGAILTVNVEVGAHTMINFGATIGHEAKIGRGCVVNPGANISGGVVLEDGVLVGTGAQVLQYKRIGVGAIVGAGAVVTRDVEAGMTVVGVPARRRL